jgi:hypothetical protein
MSESSQPDKTNRRQYAFNVIMTVAAGMAGCLTVLILFVALFVGLWLDNQFNSANHIYTVVLLVLSVPFTLVAMLWVVRVTTSRIKTAPKEENIQEEADRAGT